MCVNEGGRKAGLRSIRGTGRRSRVWKNKCVSQNIQAETIWTDVGAVLRCHYSYIKFTKRRRENLHHAVC